jgi:glycosyltransferase involved in cell wall biosynthesis
LAARDAEFHRIILSPEMRETESLRPELLFPADWQELGPNPEFYVLAPTAEPLQIRIVSREAMMSAGLDTAEALELIPLKPCGVENLVAAHCLRALPEGSYVAVLESVSSKLRISQSGFLVAEQQGAWPARFYAMQNAAASRGREFHWRAVASHFHRAPLFSITTTVYNTPPRFLQELHRCIKGQIWRDFEWLILENGSTEADTVEACKEIAGTDNRVKLFRVSENLHIIGGNRYLLERARGRYIVPVDSDDIVYPRALETLARSAFKSGLPDLLYTDEQKVSTLGTPMEFIWRPQWSRLFSLSTCPAAHILAFLRKTALERGAYSEEYARGSHDWDTALRFDDISARTVHVPDVTYGWRMHGASSAQNERSKSYLVASQMSVITNAVRRRGLEDRFELVPAHSMLSYYHLSRRRIGGPRAVIHVVVGSYGEMDAKRLTSNLGVLDYENGEVHIYLPRPLPSGVKGLAFLASRDCSRMPSRFISYGTQEELLSRMQSTLGQGQFLHLFVNNRLRLLSDDSIWDAVGTFELDKETGIVGGCILDHRNRIQNIGYVAGLDGFLATPVAGLHPAMARGAISYIRRNVTAVYGGLLAVRSTALKKIGFPSGLDEEDGLNGIEYCLRGLEQGIKTAFSPHIRALFPGTLANPAGTDAERRHLIQTRYARFLHEDPYYSAHCVNISAKYGDIK